MGRALILLGLVKLSAGQSPLCPGWEEQVAHRVLLYAVVAWPASGIPDPGLEMPCLKQVTTRSLTPCICIKYGETNVKNFKVVNTEILYIAIEMSKKSSRRIFMEHLLHPKH